MTKVKKHIRRREVEVHVFLTSALEGQWSDSFCGRFTPGTAPPCPQEMVLVKPRTSIDPAEKIKKF